jgi:hypothetical protein
MMLGMVDAGSLSDAEQRVWDAFRAGRPVEFGTGKAEDDDPARGKSWGPDRQVRAVVLTALLCGGVEAKSGQIGEVYLDRVCVIGKLELPGAAVKHRLRLHQCYVADGVDLSDATIPTLDLEGCHVGAISLLRAKIDGTFSLRGAVLDGKDGAALNAAGLTVTGHIFCDEGFKAAGEINLAGASIGLQLAGIKMWGNLSLRGADLDQCHLAKVDLGELKGASHASDQHGCPTAVSGGQNDHREQTRRSEP